MEPWGIKRDLTVKAEEETNPDYGRRPDQRPLQDYIKFGVINLDKPPGPSSHEVAAWTKRLLNIQRIGHGGTLDPKVTGILPIALEAATKIIQSLLQSGKEVLFKGAGKGAEYLCSKYPKRNNQVSRNGPIP